MPLLSSCNLIDVTGDEDANSGRGAKVFDPYQAAASGAIKLSLQVINGCAYTPNGGFIAKNSLDIPYPATCVNIDRPDPFAPSTGLLDPEQVQPKGKMTLAANTSYFLNQFSVTDSATGKHTNPNDLNDFVKWVKTETRLRNLDWRNLGQASDEHQFADKYPGVTPVATWTREVLFDNSNWQRSETDEFEIEVLDSGGVVRAKQKYSRSELLGESPYAGHSRIAWRAENIMPPTAPEDKSVRPVQSYPGNFPTPVTFRSIARVDLVGSTNPFKTLDIPALEGEGALRVKWSLLPEEPFYFPVSFVAKDTDGKLVIPPTCTNDAGQPTPCGFGLKPQVTMVAPGNNSKFYMPGETVKMFLEFRDDEGNRLHSPDTLPSGAAIMTDQANGLLSLRANIIFGTLEQDMIPIVMVAGPIQNMRTHSEVVGERSFMTAPPFPFGLVSDGAGLQVLPTVYQIEPAARFSFKVPQDAKAGTYVVFLKGNRYFMGERITRNQPFFFQVGQEQLTSYPGRVGNCQICHRGVLSLDNLRHGVPVDHVEGCKACHNANSDNLFRTQEVIHRIHMRSKKYPANKNECNVCHLTRESALRPSVALCKSCHPTTHDNEYFSTEFNTQGAPNRSSNCAQACHGEQPPKAHILPEN
jgi:hypothetical protein